MIEAKMFGWHIAVGGFRNVKVGNIDAFLRLAKENAEGREGCYVQFFDAEMIGGFDHLYFAALNALKAFETKLNISKSPAVEALLFASGQHQIRKAVDLLGLKRDSSEAIVLVVADERSEAVETLGCVSKLLGGEACDKVIELTDEKVKKIKAAFGVTDLEIEATLRQSEKEALSSLLIERAALLVTRR
jgi:tRNA threonylcarbamoyladenosine modification (KEOPS) complex Cgi121 subunit